MFVQENAYSKRNRKTFEVTERDGKTISKMKREKNIFLFLDTCTWLNQAQQANYDNFLKIADLALQRDALLIVPEQLTVEWDRNKIETVFSQQEKLIESMIRQTTSLRDKVIKDEDEKKHLTNLISQAHKFKEEQVKYVGIQTIALVEEIMDLGGKIPTDAKILTQAAQWALKKVPPFASNKNSMGDAVLFLSLMNELEKFEKPILYFVTDNKDDFSESKNYPDSHKMKSHFLEYAKGKGIEIRYFIILEDALTHILEEVTDLEYLEECEALYQVDLDRIPKCDECGEVKIRNYRPWDGMGRKMYYMCSNGHIEETGEYENDMY